MQVVRYLEERGVASALIGGVALAVHGVARATQDIDLLALDGRILDREFWDEWTAGGRAEIRKGDPDDPLAGVVKWTDGDEPIDIVVGKQEWMPAILERRNWVQVSGASLPVVDRADLILLKLFAAGPQDLLDAKLLLTGDRGNLSKEVELRLISLPASVRQLWNEITGTAT